jgi:AmmeMemoRadiSam system protein A
MLDASQRQALLAHARGAAVRAARGEPAADATAAPAGLDRPGAAFVTLRVSGELRGCIGTFEPSASLWDTVEDVAEAAARRDPRFKPLAERELPGLSVEVSVLSAPHRVSGPTEIELGKHGLEIRRGRRRGLLLPQVAADHELDVERFLAETCKKAGLPLDSWRDRQTEIWVFEAEVF